jgi:plastocyanin
MRRTLELLAVVAVAALALGLAACGDDDSESSEREGAEEAATIEIDGETANNEGTEEVTGDSVEFEEDDFYFEPTVLTGEPGQKVTLEITNEGDSEHNLTIKEQKIDEDTEPGETASVDVEIPDSGLLPFYCAFHTAQDMRGALAVTGSEPTASTETEPPSTGSSGGY